MPKKYRKKPIVIEAMKVEYGKTDVLEVEKFIGDPNVLRCNPLTGQECIKTLEGSMLISDGDYIVKGVQGEFYPCKPAIFEATYEVVSDIEDAKVQHALTTMLSVFSNDIDKSEGSVLHDLFAPFALAAVNNTVPTIPKATVNVNFENLGTEVDKVIAEMTKRMEKRVT